VYCAQYIALWNSLTLFQITPLEYVVKLLMQNINPSAIQLYHRKVPHCSTPQNAKWVCVQHSQTLPSHTKLLQWKCGVYY